MTVLGFHVKQQGSWRGRQVSSSSLLGRFRVPADIPTVDDLPVPRVEQARISLLQPRVFPEPGQQPVRETISKQPTSRDGHDHWFIDCLDIEAEVSTASKHDFTGTHSRHWNIRGLDRISRQRIDFLGFFFGGLSRRLLRNDRTRLAAGLGLLRTTHATRPAPKQQDSHHQPHRLPCRFPNHCRSPRGFPVDTCWFHATAATLRESPAIPRRDSGLHSNNSTGHANNRPRVVLDNRERSRQTVQRNDDETEVGRDDGRANQGSSGPW